MFLDDMIKDAYGRGVKRLIHNGEKPNLSDLNIELKCPGDLLKTYINIEWPKYKIGVQYKNGKLSNYRYGASLKELFPEEFEDEQPTENSFDV